MKVDLEGKLCFRPGCARPPCFTWKGDKALSLSLHLYLSLYLSLPLQPTQHQDHLAARGRLASVGMVARL